MKFLLLHDTMPQSHTQEIVHVIENYLIQQGHTVIEEVLREMMLSNCLGCFGCWIKTPGKCVITKDIANSIAIKEMSSDVIIIISEVVYGNYSPAIKNYLDRSIQNILPTFKLIEHEMHHKKRYQRYPIRISLGYGKVTTDEEKLFNQICKRNAINFHAKRSQSFMLNENLPEILQEINYGLAGGIECQK